MLGRDLALCVSLGEGVRVQSCMGTRVAILSGVNVGDVQRVKMESVALYWA